ncbi:MAG: hypothetical protein ACTHOP_17730 [Mesorhizobium sp.]
MKKPLSWKALSPLTVVPKGPRDHQSPNSGAQAAILRLVKSHSAGLSSGTGHGDHGTATLASLSRPTIRPNRSSISHDLLTYLRQSESCATLRRKGLITSYNCPIEDFDDAAVAIGLVVHFARMSLSQKCPIPPVLIELLAQQVEAGDAACIMVAEWLDAMGLAEVKPTPTRRNR